MDDKFKMLDAEVEHKDTVVSFFSSMFKVSDIISAASSVFRDNGLSALCEALKSQGKGGIPLYSYQSKWFGDGIGCEILSPGAKGWQKGKVRIKIFLEFCPDEPEIPEVPESNESENGQSKSSLDDIRQMKPGDS